MRTFIAGLSFAAAALAVACSALPDTCETNTTCPIGDAGIGEGGALADTGEGGLDGARPDAAPSCDPSLSPAQDACVVDEKYGVFVSADGSDAAGRGTKAAPFATVGYAVQHANGAPRVYVRGGTYAASIAIAAGAPALAVFGGFDNGWAYDPAHQLTKIQAPAGMPALSITGVSASLRFEGLELDAANAQASGDSSIAVHIANSSGDITFAKCTLSAGLGAAGVSGTAPTTTLPTPVAGNNADASSNNGGASTAECKCPYGTSSFGGGGGSGGGSPTDGSSGVPALSVNKGLGGAVCSNGVKGTDAPATAADGPGALQFGTLSGGTWAASSGVAGTAGGTAQGGGGGGGGVGVTSGNGGGGGGCGGCGGAGGAAGGSGGASIALLAVQSPAVTVADSTLRTAGGGAGGSGTPGQAGASGAGRGNATQTGTGCQGGSGGAGGKGGAGGGGAGGISAGIAWQASAAPKLDDATQNGATLGPAGAKGLGGKTPTNDGVVGTKAVVFQVP